MFILPVPTFSAATYAMAAEKLQKPIERLLLAVSNALATYDPLPRLQACHNTPSSQACICRLWMKTVTLTPHITSSRILASHQYPWHPYPYKQMLSGEFSGYFFILPDQLSSTSCFAE
jgi:hypothetical protein